ncbi:MAG TPA: hypothetical protein VMG08_20025 [Allosphingosinicella sp.]|nr:hypothetical protein [Allosphingosinicella sp.]
MLSLLLTLAPVTVPAGTPVALDGVFAPAEWDDARTVPLSDGFVLHLKRHGGDLLLAVRYPAPAAAGVDLFVETAEGGLLNLHASARLGERLPRGGGWSPWAWGNNRLWDSHVTMTPQAGREFRIAGARLARGTFRLRVAIHGNISIVWPAGTSEFNSNEGWAAIRLP